MIVGWRNRVVLACTLLSGCDKVFSLTDVPVAPDAPSNDLRCATRTDLLCADFEQGSSYYTNGIASDLPMATSKVTADVETPGATGGHALYIDSTSDTYRFDAQSTTAASKISATFALELARFDTTTPATSLAVLYFDQVLAPECYVALDFQPTPMRLALVGNCTVQQARDLVIPLPSGTAFVTVTLDMDLGMRMGSAHLGQSSASVDIAPGGSTTGMPGVGFRVHRSARWLGGPGRVRRSPGHHDTVR